VQAEYAVLAAERKRDRQTARLTERGQRASGPAAAAADIGLHWKCQMPHGITNDILAAVCGCASCRITAEMRMIAMDACTGR